MDTETNNSMLAYLNSIFKAGSTGTHMCKEFLAIISTAYLRP